MTSTVEQQAHCDDLPPADDLSGEGLDLAFSFATNDDKKLCALEDYDHDDGWLLVLNHCVSTSENAAVTVPAPSQEPVISDQAKFSGMSARSFTKAAQKTFCKGLTKPLGKSPKHCSVTSYQEVTTTSLLPKLAKETSLLVNYVIRGFSSTDETKAAIQTLSESMDEVVATLNQNAAFTTGSEKKKRPTPRVRVKKEAAATTRSVSLRSKRHRDQALDSDKGGGNKKAAKKTENGLAESSSTGRTQDVYRLRQGAIPRILAELADSEEKMILLKFNDALGEMGARLKVKDKTENYNERFVEEMVIVNRDEFNARIPAYLDKPARPVQVSKDSGVSDAVRNFFKYEVFVTPDKFRTKKEIHLDWRYNKWSFKPDLAKAKLNQAESALLVKHAE